MKVKISFKNILNRNLPTIEPWVTPVITSVQSLNRLFIKFLCICKKFYILLHKQFCISFKDILEKMYASFFPVASYDLLCQKPLRGPSLLFLFVLLYPNVYFRFLSFSRANLQRYDFSKMTEMRRNLCGHVVIKVSISL